MRDMKECWTIFKRGDFLSTEELQRMYDSSASAKEYLDSRLPEFHLAWVAVIHDMNKINDILYYRKVFGRMDKHA